jgi:hypothetical protein
MGEAKRRMEYVRAHADAIAADLYRRAAEQARIEELASEDPDDRACRLAHGFTVDDDWRDTTLVCRNGCGATYEDVVAGKMRKCLAQAKTRSGADLQSLSGRLGRGSPPAAGPA